MECPASAVLPQTASRSKYTDRGHGVHGAIENSVNHPEEDSVVLDGYPVPRSILDIPKDARPEWAYSYDAVSGKAEVLGHIADRNYPEVPFSTVVGTTDLVWPSTLEFEAIDGTFKCVNVRDWKTNREPPPNDTWQMRFLGFASARAYGYPYARTQITSIIDGYVQHGPFRLWGPEDHLETEKLLRSAYDRVNKLGWRKDKLTAQDVRHGPHCHWCPALSSCGYFQNLLKGPQEVGGALITNLDASVAYARWQSLRTLTGRMEEAVKSYSTTQAIQLEKGYFYGPTGDKGHFKRYRSK